MRWLVIPVALGLVVAGGGYWLSSLLPDREETDPPSPWVTVFGDGALHRDLVVYTGNESLSGPLPDCGPCAGGDQLGPALHRINATASQSDGPRALQNGYDAGRATIYVFQPRGALLASNAPIQETGRFTLSGDYQEVGDPVWWLGEGRAPNGTATIPFLRQEARETLRGLAVGDVETRLLVDHQYAWLIGPVVVSARIDSLVHVDDL